MDCSSKSAIAGVLALYDKFDLAFINDPDYDKHNISTYMGLINANYYLATVINFEDQ